LTNEREQRGLKGIVGKRYNYLLDVLKDILANEVI